MAMAEQIYEVQLEGGGPWGFRLQGGKDFGQPLVIAKITPGGKASNCGVNQGETILEIANHSTEEMTHFDAQNAIRKAGQSLQLRLQRTSKAEGKTQVVTETVHSGKVDHKYNAMPKPFGQSSPTPSHQPVQAHPPASSTTRKIPQAQAPPTVRTGPPGVNPVPPPPVAPAHRGPPARPMNNVHTRDVADGHSHVDRTQHVEDEDLVNRFKFNISDDGEVEQQEHWGHPPDPNVQSKSFKNLMKHLDHEGTEDFPPPPPEAFQPEEEEDTKQVQSRSFKFLQDTVSSGEAPPSVFSRATEDRSKPSTTPLPPMYRPKPPVIRPAVQVRPVGSSPVAARLGQPQPVALPGMVEMAPVQSSPSRVPSSPAHHAPSSARSPSSPTGQQEIKRSPIKPGGSQPVPEGTRTPYCAGCGEEIFGPFASAIGKTWHPDHFVCDVCGVSLQYKGFMEEEGKVYCESDYNKFFAPQCSTCKQPIVGAKSLHKCPKAVPAPSGDMLRSLRASFKGTKSGKEDKPAVAKQMKPRFNNALMLRRGSEDNPTSSPTKSPTSPFAVDYLHRISSVEESKTKFSPPVVNRPSGNFGDIKSGLASVRDKVDALKESIHKVTEQEKEFSTAVPQANRRYVDAMDTISDIQRKIATREEKLWKIERNLKMREGKVLERHRTVEENVTLKHRIEHEKTENVKDGQTMRQQMRQFAAVRESALVRLHDASTQVVQFQTAIQKAEQRRDRATRRLRLLEDALDAFKKRIRDMQFKSSHKVVRADNQHLKLNDLEDAIAGCDQRYLMAEKKALPLSIYVNQLQDGLQKDQQQLRQTQYLLANYQQRLKGCRYNNYYHHQ